MIYTAGYSSPLGKITLAARGGALVGLWLDRQRGLPCSDDNGGANDGDEALLDAIRWLDGYFSGARPDIRALRIAPEGSEFRQTVWRLLCDIPYGSTETYGSVARRAAAELGCSQMSAQAVGGAVGHNPISIIIPCHRVVGADGKLVGYGGGLDLKTALLAHEGVNTSVLRP